LFRRYSLLRGLRGRGFWGRLCSAASTDRQCDRDGQYWRGAPKVSCRHGSHFTCTTSGATALCAFGALAFQLIGSHSRLWKAHSDPHEPTSASRFPWQQHPFLTTSYGGRRPPPIRLKARQPSTAKGRALGTCSAPNPARSGWGKLVTSLAITITVITNTSS